MIKLRDPQRPLLPPKATLTVRTSLAASPITLMKFHLLAASAVIAAACGSASAAVVTYSSYIGTGVSDTSWVITTAGVTSVNMNVFSSEAIYTYGGVDWTGTFSDDVTVGGVRVAHKTPEGYSPYGSSFLYPTNPTINLFSTGSHYDGGNTNIIFEGLVAGQQYMAKFLFADSTSTTNGTLTLTSGEGNTGNSGPLSFEFRDGRFLVVTAVWTADGPNDNFVRSLGSASYGALNAVQIVAIPEASAASLLGAVGVLGLLRRRR